MTNVYRFMYLVFDCHLLLLTKSWHLIHTIFLNIFPHKSTLLMYINIIQISKKKNFMTAVFNNLNFKFWIFILLVILWLKGVWNTTKDNFLYTLNWTYITFISYLKQGNLFPMSKQSCITLSRYTIYALNTLWLRVSHYLMPPLVKKFTPSLLISQYNLVLQATWVVDIFIIFMQWFWHSAVIRIKHCCSRWREKRNRVGLTGTRPPPRCHCPSSPRSPFLKNVPSRSTEYAVS